MKPVFTGWTTSKRSGLICWRLAGFRGNENSAGTLQMLNGCNVFKCNWALIGSEFIYVHTWVSLATKCTLTSSSPPYSPLGVGGGQTFTYITTNDQWNIDHRKLTRNFRKMTALNRFLLKALTKSYKNGHCYYEQC